MQPMKIALKLSLLLTAIILGVVALQTSWSVDHLDDLLAQDARRDLTSAAVALQSRATDAWARGGAEEAARSMAEAAEVLPRLQIRLVVDGPTRPSSGDPGPRTGEDDRVLIEDLPVVVNGVPRATLQLTMELGAEHARFESVVRQSIEMAIGLVLACVLAVILGTVRLVGRPLATLGRLARRVGEGDLTVRAKVSGRDEMAHLAAEMNAMADRLASAQARVSKESARRISAIVQLRHAQRLKIVGQLTSALVHELGTPLNVISGRANMIARGQVEAPEARECAQIIVDQAKRVTTRIRSMLEFARGQPAPHRPLDLLSVVQESCELLAPLMSKKSAEVVVHANPDDHRVTGDPIQLEQVVTNLLMNASQAMPRGGTIHVELDRVDLEARPDRKAGAYLRLKVTDEGIGMSEDVRSHIFEPFFSTKEEGQGTGLGLSVSNGIIQDHGGFIEVESAPGRGSTLSVFLPWAADLPKQSRASA